MSSQVASPLGDIIAPDLGEVESRMLIGSDWRGGQQSRPVDDPATDRVIAEIPQATAQDVADAIDAAADAFGPWSRLPARQRAIAIRNLSDLMARDRERLAVIMTTEQGKPLAESRAEIDYAAGFIEWSAEEAKRIYGETVPSPSVDKRISVNYQPVGVCGIITPWNFPAAMITRKLGPALAAGCTVVIKPASQTPLTAIAIAQLALEAGVPPGVLNLVTGQAAQIASGLFDDSRVRKVSFTGSTEVGRLLMGMAAKNITRLSLELGGHAPLIVFDDADLDVAVRETIGSKFRNGGQTCICANRIFVAEAIHDEYADRLAREIAALSVGSGFDPTVDIGPLIDDKAMTKVEAHLEDAVHRGAEVVVGGHRLALGQQLADRFFSPTLLVGADRDMLVSTEETFGPVAALQQFKDEDEVLRRANDTPYGLAAYLFTQNVSRAYRVAERLDYGIVGVNDGRPSTPEAPFGGMKESGLGREGGKWGVHEYLETKYLSWAIQPSE